jgi:hypothetical protein
MNSAEHFFNILFRFVKLKNVQGGMAQLAGPVAGKSGWLAWWK